MVKIAGTTSNCPGWPFRFKGSMRDAKAIMQSERETDLLNT